MRTAGGKTHEVMVNASTVKIESEETVTAQEEAAETKAETAKKNGKTAKGAKASKPEKSEKAEKADKGE